MARGVPVVLAALALSGLALASAGGDVVVLRAALSGKAERPRGAPEGQGTATIRVSGTRLCWTLKVRGTDTPQAAHVHKGGPRASGPVVVALGKAYKPSGCVVAPAAVARAIVAKPSAYYVNVHTKRYPGGAVRGQLARSSPASSGGYGGGDSSGGSPGGYGYGDYGDTGP